MKNDIQDITVIRKMQYSPDAYIEMCEEDGTEPTNLGFLEFVRESIDEDFRNGTGSQEIFLGDWNNIIVTVNGGVADCDDSRVKIIDYDSLDEE